jgi:hypothetical protein
VKQKMAFESGGIVAEELPVTGYQLPVKAKQRLSA